MQCFPETSILQVEWSILHCHVPHHFQISVKNCLLPSLVCFLYHVQLTICFFFCRNILKKIKFTLQLTLVFVSISYCAHDLALFNSISPRKEAKFQLTLKKELGRYLRFIMGFHPCKKQQSVLKQSQ